MIVSVLISNGQIIQACQQVQPGVWKCAACGQFWTESWLMNSQSCSCNCCGAIITIKVATYNWQNPQGQAQTQQWQGIQTPSGGLKMSGNARIWWDSSINAYRMTVPFNTTFNEMFKNLLPHSDRDWNRETKTWTITERFYAPTKALLDKMFGSVVAIDRITSEKASQPPAIKVAPIDSVFTQFVKLLPYEAMQKAYRHAAMVLHPDREGGDMNKMADLNACWTRLEKEFYKKGS